MLNTVAVLIPAWGKPKLAPEPEPDPPSAIWTAVAVAVCWVLPLLLLKNSAKKTTTGKEQKAPSAVGFDFVAQNLLPLAASWWFPWVAAAGTAINLFTLVFTAATVVIFLSAVLARRERWVSTALANAIGATVGTAVLLTLIRARGEPLVYLTETYPTVLTNPAWQKAMGYMDTYGESRPVLTLLHHPPSVGQRLAGPSVPPLTTLAGFHATQVSVACCLSPPSPFSCTRSSLLGFSQAATTTPGPFGHHSTTSPGSGPRLDPRSPWRMCAGMSNTTILSIVLAGRTVKYLVMAYVTTSAPHLLKYFGVKASLMTTASDAAKKAS